MKKIEIKMYIARDEGIYNDDYECLEKGKLHLFYDTPLKEIDSKTNTVKFGCARCIGEVPSYMYPWVEEGTCHELNSINTDYREKLRNFSKEVKRVLKTKLLKGYREKDYIGFRNGLGEDMSYDIENLVEMAENNLK